MNIVMSIKNILISINGFLSAIIFIKAMHTKIKHNTVGGNKKIDLLSAHLGCANSQFQGAQIISELR